MIPFALVCFFCALVPAVMFSVNLFYYREPPLQTGVELPAVSILIPARNEAGAIADALYAVLATRNIAFEVIVMDDGSTDSTAQIVSALAKHDPRVRLEQAPALPTGWNGKQHACWALAHAAHNPILCFVDADVRLAPDCIARMVGFLESSQSALVSGFPRQVTETSLEWLLLPLIHFVLLGFLPIARMRMGTDPAFAAGCGQFMLARASDYFACGGHSRIRQTMHDGLRLPRLFRAAGLRTDLADLTNLATCRMYTSASQVWSGLAKNATEGIADPIRITPITLVLFLGQIVPFLLAAGWLVLAAAVLFISSGSLNGPVTATHPAELWVLTLTIASSVAAAWLPRILSITCFKQDWRSALLHPLGILILLAVQWYALLRKLRGGPVSWRDRIYAGDN